MKILIADNYDSFTYNLKQLIDNIKDCEYEIIKHDKIEIGTLEKYDKILISPGPELPINHPILFEIIANFQKKIPILGICLGCQAIAEYFGAKLYNLEQPYHGIATKIKICNHDIIYEGINNNFQAGLYHSWAIDENNFPIELEITSKSEDNIIMSIKHKYSMLRGIQFHPESIMTEVGQKIINNWLNQSKF